MCNYIHIGIESKLIPARFVQTASLESSNEHQAAIRPHQVSNLELGNAESAAKQKVRKTAPKT
jgi:hypothetical protein